jgi:hypothetical protein
VAGERASTERAAPAFSVFSDAPTEQDELGRERYVDALADIALRADTPIVVAIYGAWGSGKTSLMRQLRRRLDPHFDADGAASPPTDLRTVWFDPWMHQFDDSPAVGLLHATTEQLGLDDKAAVKDSLVKIAMALAEDIQIPYVGLRIGRIFKVREELAADEFRRRELQARLREEFQRVLEAAGAPHTRLVFFVDDLDRCRPRQTMRILEALKLYLDMEGCVYVLGVDRTPLEAAVHSEYKQLKLSATSFLDKIVQLPFSLPAIDDAAMRSFVSERVPPELNQCTEMLVTAGADDPRQVKRIVNSLLLNVRLVPPGARIDHQLLAALILVQNMAPELYRILRIDPAQVHDLWKTDSVLWADHVAHQPRLSAALRLVSVPADLDARRYFSLTEAVASPKPEEVVLPPVDQSGSVIELGRGEGQARLTDSAVDSLARTARAALADASLGPAPAPGDREGLVPVLARLARVGRRMFEDMRLSLQPLGAQTLAGASQVVSIRSKVMSLAWLPAELVYDRPLDMARASAEFALCPSFRRALEPGAPLGESECWTGACPVADDAAAVCPSGFWGFRHAVVHVVPMRTEPDIVVRYQGTPEVATVAGSELKRVDAHLQRLAAALPHVEWLRVPGSEAFLALLREGTPQVIYLYCRGGVDDGIPWLLLADGERFYSASIHMLGGKRPFVLINSDLGGDGLAEFARAFVLHGAAGAAGPEVAVSESLAQAFAERLIERLLRGEPIEWAHRDARLDLLALGDPLSLAYTAVAPPGTHLERDDSGAPAATVSRR